MTGERALFVNPVFTRYIVGLTDRESGALLGLLFEQIARPQFTVRFRWEPDSIAFWDNRATAHLGPVDLATAEFDRRVERVTARRRRPRKAPTGSSRSRCTASCSSERAPWARSRDQAKSLPSSRSRSRLSMTGRVRRVLARRADAVDPSAPTSEAR